MKKLFLVMVMGMMSLSLCAQDCKNSLAISFGTITHRTFRGLGQSEYWDDEDEKGEYFGSFSLEYFRNLNKIFGVGAIANYEHEKEPLIDLYGNYIALMPTVRAYWFNHTNEKVNFAMYSKLAVGPDLCFRSYDTGSETESETSIKLAFQASVISFEVGGRRLRGFLELGYGMQGIVNIGLRYSF